MPWPGGWRSTVSSCCLGSLLVDRMCWKVFGISLPVVRIGGGLVVTAFGWQLLNSGASADGDAAAASEVGKPLDTFYPFTMPLTVGPGSISAAIALGSQRPTTWWTGHA